MKNFKMSLSLVNNNSWDLSDSHEMYQKIQNLVGNSNDFKKNPHLNMTGKQFIMSLVGDDTGAPPLRLDVFYTDVNGNQVEFSIPYDENEEAYIYN
jgi:hypothetical protein